MKHSTLQKFSISRLNTWVKAFMLVLMTPMISFGQAPYCTPSYSSGCNSGDDLSSFVLNGTPPSQISDLNTVCGTNGYQDRTSITPATLTIGGTFTGTVSTNYVYGNEYVRLWIDFNNDNTFSPTEAVTGTLGPFASITPQAYSFTLPVTTQLGVHRMRVRLAYGNTNIDPCANINWGETHDYLVNVIPNLPPCNGKPEAGTISGPSICPNFDYTMRLNGASQATDLNYQWYVAPNASATFTPVANSNADTLVYNSTTTECFFAVVTCNLSNLADTTPIFCTQLNPFYQCYCNTSFPTSSAGMDIGNLKLVLSADTVLNNGNGIPTFFNTTANRSYTTFYNLTPTPLHQDSTYKTRVKFITDGALFTQSKAWIYIDYNQDGVYGAAEYVTTDTINSLTQLALGQFTVPNTAKIGLTGMRVILAPFNFNGDPCIDYSSGETEDYVVEIRYPNCDGPPNAGIAYSNDSISCIGYPVELYDTTYQKNNFTLSRVWQRSPDNFVWGDIPGSNNKDSIQTTFPGLSFYRLKIICGNSQDTSYSNVLKVALANAYECYCFSMAIGKAVDTADVGSFSIGKYSWAVGGPHVFNPRAVRGRTSYVRPPIELHQDSSYNFTVYHIDRGLHANAKVTLFMDFNNSLTYEPATERVYTGFTSATNWYLTGSVTIPTAVIMNAPTGMRLIINDNTGPNVPSDNACGTYTSGETEDYVIIFRPNPVGISEASNLSLLNVFPNPATDLINIRFDAKQTVKQAAVTLTTVTGQVLDRQIYEVNGKTFMQTMKFNNLPSGIYMLQLVVDGQQYNRKVVIQ